MEREKQGVFATTGGFWLLLGGLLLAAPLSVVGWAVVAAAVHELGHWGAVRACGGRVRSLRLTALGAVMTPAGGRMFTHGEDLFMALAGPGASLVLALLCLPVCPVLGQVSLRFGLFNLLPVMPLDGGRALAALRDSRR